MQRSSITIKRLVPILFMFLMISCKEEETVSTTCFILDKTEIQNTWVDGGLTNPSRPSSERALYIRFTPNPNAEKNEIKVTAQPYNDQNMPVGDPININGGNPCPISLTGVEFGYTSIELGKLGIFEDNGNLVSDFKSLKLKPAEIDAKGTKYFMFEVEVENNSGVTRASGPSLPCPPCYYCRPIPPDCSYDTTVNGDTLQSIQTPEGQ